MSVQPTSESVFCTQCGTRNAAGQKFCGNCGNALAQTASSSEPPVLNQPTAVTSQRKGKGRLLKGCLIGVGVLLLLAILPAIFGNSSDDQSAASASRNTTQSSSSASSTTQDDAAQESKQVSSEHFDRSNWATLHTDPDAHKNAIVEIVGKVFRTPEKTDDGIGWQMWSDPKNSEWNTLVFFQDPDFAIKDGDFVRVTGTVKGAFEGENAFGAKLTAPMINADTATVVDALAAATPAKRTAEVDESQTQHDLTLTLQKVEFAEDETRLFLKVVNGSDEKASFYSFNSKALQGSSQFEAEYSSDYPEVQSELLAGVESSGVIVFPAMDSTKATKFVLEARTDDYGLDFEPYIFEIQP